MTKIKVIKKKLNLDIKNQDHREKRLKIVIKIKIFKKKLKQRHDKKSRFLRKIKQKNAKNQG